MDQSVEMARELSKNGFEAAVASPHVLERGGPRLTPEKIEEVAAALNQRLAAEGIAFKVYPGAEYVLDRPLPELARRLFPLMTMAKSLYLLVELPMMQWPNYMEYSIWPKESDPPELRKLLPFLRPVIAHPERNQEVLRDPRRLAKLRELGYLFQVNLESLLGLPGRQTVKTISKMAKEGFIDLVGTDGHSPEGLQKLMPDWRRHVEKVLGRERAAIVLDENPLRIIHNEPIEPEE
jgi:protein-tyrosine phosphatase